MARRRPEKDDLAHARHALTETSMIETVCRQFHVQRKLPRRFCWIFDLVLIEGEQIFVSVIDELSSQTLVV
jgi:hypothetical protein